MSDNKEINEKLDRLIERQKELAIESREIHDRLMKQLDEIDDTLKKYSEK